MVFNTIKILKSGEISEDVSHRKQSPYCDTWLSCLLCATTPHPPGRLPAFLNFNGRNLNNLLLTDLF